MSWLLKFTAGLALGLAIGVQVLAPAPEVVTVSTRACYEDEWRDEDGLCRAIDGYTMYEPRAIFKNYGYPDMPVQYGASRHNGQSVQVGEGNF